MLRSRLGFRVLGLCAMVFGLMAVVAGAAQAEAGSNWMLNGANLANNTLKPALQIESLDEGDGALLTTLVGIPVKVLCKKAELIGVALLLEGKLTEGKVDFSDCATYLEGKETPSAPCLPISAGVNDLIITNTGKGLIKLVLTEPGKTTAVEPVTNIEPASGAELAVIESSEKCAVGQKIVIRGNLALKDCKKEFSVEAKKHLIEESVLGTALTANNKPATIDGSAIVHLIGAHLDNPFSGLPSATKP